MATEIPSHNLGEVAAAAIHKIENPLASNDELLALIPGPDYPGGGQIISSRPPKSLAAYGSGRGSLRVRARYEFEELARGAWQLVIRELPPGVSSAKRALRNRRADEPAAQARQEIDRAVGGAVESAVRHRNSNARATSRARTTTSGWSSSRSVRGCRATSSSRLLLAHTSLETTAPINLVAVGIDGRPCQKTLADLIGEWCQFRVQTVRRRSEHRLAKTLDRIHILEGRHIVFLNIDEVIHLIRESDEPKPALIELASRCPSGKPTTSSKSACASWRGSKGSRSSRSSKSCAVNAPTLKSCSPARRCCAGW